MHDYIFTILKRECLEREFLGRECLERECLERENDLPSRKEQDKKNYNHLIFYFFKK